MNGMSSSIPITGKHKDYLSILGYLYLKNNQPARAIVVYKALWYLFPESENLAFCLSYLHLQAREFEPALFYADACIGRKGSGLGYLLKSQALLELGRQHQAREAIKQYFIHSSMEQLNRGQAADQDLDEVQDRSRDQGQG